MCGTKKRTKLQAHHIYPKGIKKYSNKTFSLSNGITLCDRCHGILHSSKQNWRRFTPMFRQYMERKRVYLFNKENQNKLFDRTNNYYKRKKSKKKSMANQVKKDKAKAQNMATR